MSYRTTIAFLAATLVTFPVYAGGVDTAAFVAAHNKWRAEVGVTEKLAYSRELEMSAQVWADNLKKNNRCKMRHSKRDGRSGENIFWASALAWSDGRKELQQVTAKQVVDRWGSEKANYDYTNNSCMPGKMCGHYTQVVWRATRKIGCAMAVCDDTQAQVWVCQYQPAGNWVGEKPY